MQKRWRMQKRKNTRRMKSGKKRRRVQRMERRKRLKKAKRFQRRKRIRRKRVMSRIGLYVMADNYCFPAFGSILKIDESLPSINVHLPHQLTAYTDQFLLSLPYPSPSPPRPTRLSSSSSRRLSRLGLINLSIISRPPPAEEERARRR